MPAFTERNQVPMPAPGRNRVIVDFADVEAMAMAQLCKRFNYDDAVRFSNRHDGGQERDDLRAAIDTLERALAQAGFAPR
jgi:hypothetical protein